MDTNGTIQMICLMCMFTVAIFMCYIHFANLPPVDIVCAALRRFFRFRACSLADRLTGLSLRPYLFSYRRILRKLLHAPSLSQLFGALPALLLQCRPSDGAEQIVSGAALLWLFYWCGYVKLLSVLTSVFGQAVLVMVYSEGFSIVLVFTHLVEAGKTCRKRLCTIRCLL